MANLFIRCLTFLLFPLLLSAQTAPSPSSAPYAPGIVVFKLKGEMLPSLKAAGTKTGVNMEQQARVLANSVGAKKLIQPFASSVFSKKAVKSARKSEKNTLSSLFKLELEPGQQVEEVVRQLQSSKLVEYAEPYYLPQLLRQPDDEFLPQQKHLGNIKAAPAWEITQGSREVVIGILDTGVDLNHPDLKDNLYLNTSDPVDGVDNDGDGFTDNYYGWDFANNDNDPSADRSGHGTMVAGFSSATTNNDIGIAGTGYKCRYIPIKIFRSEDNRFRNGYEAMVYAAEMGCDILNLSWGGAGVPSQYVQDIINFLVLEKDVVIIAAAGNDPEELNFYPASYDNVLSVSSSDYTDAKADYATWSRFVDLLAPGKAVFSTTNGSGYGSGQGTSFACPQVAGAAGLIRSFFPELNARQVMERLRVSADSVNDSAFPEKIGKGRLNMEKALARTSSPAVRMQQFEVFNGTGPFAFYNDTLEIRLDLINFLSPTTDLTLTLTTDSKYVSMIDSVVNTGTIHTLGTYRNDTTPFRLYLQPNLPGNEVITFRIGYSDINYKDYQYFQLQTSGTFFDFASDQLSLTVSSEGNLGYNYNYNLQGSGFRFENAPLAHNLGLVLAQSAGAVATNTMYRISPAERFNDFGVIDRLKIYTNSNADRDARSSFQAITSEEVPLNIRVEQKILGWEDTLSSAAMVIEYRLLNQSDSAYQQLYTGLFTDFDINEFYNNKGTWDATARLGYAYDSEMNRFAGVAVISDHSAVYRALDIASRNGNTNEFPDSLHRAGIYAFLSGESGKEVAGEAGSGNDVAQIIGGTVPVLKAGSSEKVTFALLTASSLEELKVALEAVKENYQNYLRKPPLNSEILACPANQLEINPSDGNLFRFYSDPFGHDFITEASSVILENLSSDTTLYVARVDSGYPADIERIEVLVRPPYARFSLSADTIAVSPGEKAVLQLTDESEFPAHWYWNFNNGYQSIQQSPKAYFDTPGTYAIELIMTNTAGCSDTLTQQLVVVQKNATPLLNNQLLCSPGTASLKSSDGSSFNLYADAHGQEKIFTGTLFETPLLTEDTTFYASSGHGVYESKLLTLDITVFDAGLHLSYQVDTLSDAAYALLLQAEAQNHEQVARIEWFVNGQMEQQGDRLLWPYSTEDEIINLQAYAYYRNGCIASISEEVQLQKSPVPLLDSQTVCRGDNTLLRPQQEGIYYFYYTAEKDSLLKKGREYLLKGVQASHTYYITSISLGQESEPLAVNISVPENLAGFTISADTVYLNEGKPLQCRSTDSGVTEWLWDFGNGITSSLAEPHHLYEKPGTFTVRLQAKNSQGCTEIQEKQLVVLQTTSVEGGQANSSLKVSPNPATEVLHVQLPPSGSVLTLYLYDGSGRQKAIYRIPAGSDFFTLNVRSFPAGLYWLRLKSDTDNKEFTSRFIRE